MEEASVHSLDAARILLEANKLEPTITQDGVARAFARHNRDVLRFDHSKKCWYRWTGTYWRQDRTNQAFEDIRVTARDLSEGADGKVLRELRRTSFVAGVEKFCRSDPEFAVTADVWDPFPFLIGTPGGTVELTRGVLRPSDPIDMVSKVTAVTPADEPICPTWLRFMSEATRGDMDLVRFLQQWAGYCLTGNTDEQALMFGYGDGGNGKGVFLNTIAGIMGHYAVATQMDTLEVAFGDRHTADLAMLCGARLVTASETEKGRAWAESRIKQLTGGDPVTARFMHKNPFTFIPTFKLTIIGNDMPKLSNVNEAMRRRFNVVPFTHKPAHPDLDLNRKLRREWPGILRWMLNGCLDWRKNRLVRPDVVLQATQEYFLDQDLFGQWLERDCIIEEGNLLRRATSAELYKSWTAFAREADQKPGSQIAMAKMLQKRHLAPLRTSKFRGFTGIAMKDDDA